MHNCVRATLVAVALSSAAALHAQSLSLDDAITRAVAASPLGASDIARLDTLSAARSLADTRPTDTVDVLVENLGIGGSDLNRQIQLTGTYNRRLERGGKRGFRIGAAEADIAVARAEAVVRRLEVAALVQRLYVEVQAGEALVEVAQERVSIAEQLSREVGRRVTAARDPLFAGTRARTQLAEARVDLELAIHARDAALARLTSLWGAPSEQVSISGTDFLDVREVSASSSSDRTAADNMLLEARRSRSAAELSLQRASRRADLTVSGGPRLIATGDVAIVAGVSMPLRNRGLNRANIARAEAQARQVEADLAVDVFQRRQQIALVAEKVNETAHEVEAIRDKVVPGALKTLAEVRAGYNRGGFTFLDVSTAQTALHEARARMVRAATRHHEARVELDRLTGRFADLVQDTQ